MTKHAFAAAVSCLLYLQHPGKDALVLPFPFLPSDVSAPPTSRPTLPDAIHTLYLQGRVLTEEEFQAEMTSKYDGLSVEEATRGGKLGAYSAPPNTALTVLGAGLFAFLQGRIAETCRNVYPVVSVTKCRLCGVFSDCYRGGRCAAEDHCTNVRRGLTFELRVCQFRAVCIVTMPICWIRTVGRASENIKNETWLVSTTVSKCHAVVL